MNPLRFGIDLFRHTTSAVATIRGAAARARKPSDDLHISEPQTPAPKRHGIEIGRGGSSVPSRASDDRVPARFARASTEKWGLWPSLSCFSP